MATPSKFRLLALLGLLLIVRTSLAQQSDIDKFQPVLTQGSYVKVYENVTSEFQKKFPDAQNVRWYGVNKNYLAKFSIQDMEQRALLDRRGNLIYKITYGKEKHLPSDIRKLVKRSYVEVPITAAALVEEANRSIWIINLEDDGHYIVVRVENSEMEEVRKYEKKGTPVKK